MNQFEKRETSSILIVIAAVALLPYFSKIIEKVIETQLIVFRKQYTSNQDTISLL